MKALGTILGVAIWLGVIVFGNILNAPLKSDQWFLISIRVLHCIFWGFFSIYVATKFHDWFKSHIK